MAKPLLELRKGGICVGVHAWELRKGGICADVHAWVLAESSIDRLFSVKLVGEVPLVEGTTEAPLPGAAEETKQSSSNELAEQFESETALRLACSMDCDAQLTAQPDAQFRGQDATSEPFYIGSEVEQERDDAKGLAESLAEGPMEAKLAAWEALRSQAAAVGPRLGIHRETLVASGLAGGERLATVPPFPALTTKEGVQGQGADWATIVAHEKGVLMGKKDGGPCRVRGRAKAADVEKIGEALKDDPFVEVQMQKDVESIAHEPKGTAGAEPLYAPAQVWRTEMPRTERVVHVEMVGEHSKLDAVMVKDTDEAKVPVVDVQTDNEKPEIETAALDAASALKAEAMKITKAMLKVREAMQSSVGGTRKAQKELLEARWTVAEMLSIFEELFSTGQPLPRSALGPFGVFLEAEREVKRLDGLFVR
ncbi:unnamed protein product [Prorocentrum cordatum]|uniref:Uncharacterized protein n=1 Tax=Prorocentrum cordatum TaxID=2364126 RepID=A0ABN9S5E5_9DINO|nr:unnamed protein product [Polarella glacialis]